MFCAMPMALHSKIRSTLRRQMALLAVLLLLTHDDVASAMPSPWPVPTQTVPGKLNGNPFAGVTGTSSMIAAGAYEVQLDLIARLTLDLPRSR